MAFTLSGKTITQSGTDTSLAGLSGIAGVTVQTIAGLRYPLTIYTLTDRKLTVNGSLSMTRNEKIIFNGQGASNSILNIDGGTLTINQVYTRNSYAYSLPQEAIVFALTSDGTWNTEVLVTRNAGKLIAKNVLIRIPHSIWFIQNTSGQVLLENVVLDKTGSTGDIQTNHSGSGNNNTVFRNVTILADGQSGITFRNSVAPIIENVKVYQSRDAFNNESGSAKIVRGLEPNLGNLVDISQWDGNTTVAVNAQKGIEFLWGGHLGSSSAHRGEVAVYQELTAKVSNASGVGIQNAVFYLTDNPIVADTTQTSVPNATLTGNINPVNRQTYIATSDASGVISRQDVLIGTGKRTVGGAQIAGGNDNRIRPRGINTTASVDATDDVYNYSVLGYAYLQANNPIVLKSGNGNAVNATPQLLPDNNITLSENDAVEKLASSFTVDSGINTITVTANSTLDDLYDAMKAWKTRNVQAQLEYPTISTQPVTANGDTLITAMNVVGIEFLTTGTKFKKLQANATANGTISNLSIVGNVNQATPTNLSNVQISGTLTYNTNTATSIAISNNTAIGTVANSGTGIVTISRDNTSSITTYTDAEINFLDSNLSAVGITSATIYGSQADRDSGVNPGATFTTSLDFKYGSVVSGVTMQDTVYLRVVVGSVTLFSQITLVTGSNVLDLGVQGQLSAINAKVDLTAKETTLLQTETDVIAEINASEIKIDTAITKIDTKPTLTQIEGSTILSKEATVLQSEIDIIAEVNANETKIDAVKAKTDTLVNTDLSLVAKTTELTTAKNDIITEVNEIPINPLLASNYVAPDNTNIGLIKTKVDTLQNADFTATNAKIDTKPSLTQIEASTVLAKEATILQTETDIVAEINANEVKIDGIKYKTDTLVNAPTLSEIEASTVLAKEATSQTINTKVDQTNDNLPKVNRNVIKASKSIPAGETF